MAKVLSAFSERCFFTLAYFGCSARRSMFGVMAAGVKVGVGMEVGTVEEEMEAVAMEEEMVVEVIFIGLEKIAKLMMVVWY